MRLPTAKQEAFAVAIVAGASQMDAYRTAYGTTQAKDKSIRADASRALRNPVVRLRIEQLRQKIADKVGFGREDVIRHLVEIATADSNELTQFRRENCRHCWGTNGAYRWIDEEEFMESVAKVQVKNDNAKKLRHEVPVSKGGFGFRKTDRPNPDCKQCCGEGIGRDFMLDTRTLSPSARRLFAGIKRTKNGLEVKTRDQDFALKLLAQHFQVLPTSDVSININNNPSVTEIPAGDVPANPQDAARFYQSIMQGKK